MLGDNIFEFARLQFVECLAFAVQGFESFDHSLRHFFVRFF